MSDNQDLKSNFCAETGTYNFDAKIVVEQFSAGGELFSADMSDEDKSALLVRIKNEEILDLVFKARVFPDAPNKNNIRPRPGTLGLIADTAAGGVWAQDHRMFNSNARRGTVIGGSVEDFEEVPWVMLDMTAKDPKAQAGVVRGLIDLFSIGLNFSQATAACSVCEAKVLPNRFGLSMSCDHEPGQTFESALCEVFVDGATFGHIADVLSPAATGTAVFNTTSTNKRGIDSSAAPPEDHTMSDNDREALETRAADEEQKRKDVERKFAASQAKLFELTFKSAVESFRVAPSERDELKQFFDAAPDACMSSIDKRRPNPAYASQASGTDNGGERENSSQNEDNVVEFDRYALLRTGKNFDRKARADFIVDRKAQRGE